MATQTVNFAGQIEVTRVDLISVATGKTVDLSKIMLEMNIYEDIFSNYITGTISIIDSVDLVNYAPLVGEERLEIEYKTPGMDDANGKVNNIFYVYKVADKALVKDKAQAYVIYFMSEEGFIDQHVKDSKAYKGSLSKMALDLFSDADALGARDEVVNKFVVEETANAFQLVVPTWSPMKAINWVAARSVSRKGKAANYLFYQDSFKYNFISINSLVTQQPTMKFWDTTLNVRQLQQATSSEEISQYNIVRSSAVDLLFDVATRMASGMFASKMIAYDILSKTVNIQQFDYINDFDKSNHLNKFPINSKKVMRNPNSCTITYPIHSSMFDEFSSDFPETWLLQRRSLLQQITSYRGEIVVAGRTDYKVGMVVELNFHTVRNHTTKEESEERYHKGNYLVASINHRITKNEHECIMSVIKDSIITNLN